MMAIIKERPRLEQMVDIRGISDAIVRVIECYIYVRVKYFYEWWIHCV